MTNAPPSRNMAFDNTLYGAFKLFGAKQLQNTDDMLPAKVIAYDRSTNYAQVQPLIVMVNTLNQRIERGQIASVPVLQLGGGGFVISIPIQTGDIGWIKANDRDISLFKKNLEMSAPNTQRMHSFEDAVFIPDSFMRNVVIDSEDANNLVIQNLSGTVRIALWDDKVKITAPGVIVDTPLTTFTGNILVEGEAHIVGDTLIEANLTALGNMTIEGESLIEGNATLEGTLQVDGAITGSSSISVDGTIHADGNITSGTVGLTTHTHPGVQTGGGNTGAPNP